MAKNDFMDMIHKIEHQTGIHYDQQQKEAIAKAVKSNFSVITGGPGVGKTTVTKAIIEVLWLLGNSVILAAPTGRAAKRMTEVCGYEAKTIHRLLEYNPMGGYQKNAEQMLEGDVLNIDESSMIDILLMHNLLKAVPPTMAVVLIGDIDQLPSVGAGNVIKDIILSDKAQVIRLTKIYRQGLESGIVSNAHLISKGIMPELKTKNEDFFFMERAVDDIPALIEDLYAKRLPNYYGIAGSVYYSKLICVDFTNINERGERHETSNDTKPNST